MKELSHKASYLDDSIFKEYPRGFDFSQSSGQPPTGNQPEAKKKDEKSIFFNWRR